MRRIAVMLTALLSLAAAAHAQSRGVWLDTLDLRNMRQSWSTAQRNRSVQGKPITIAGRRFERGVGTHAVSRFAVPCAGATRFSAWVGVDDEMQGYPGSVEFQLLGDGKLLWKSGVMRVGTPAMRADVPLKGVTVLQLVVTDGGDNINADHADWADARIEGIDKADTSALILSSEQASPLVVRPKWESLHADTNALGGEMRIGGKAFGTGIGVRGGTDIIFLGLGGKYQTFSATVGVDDASKPGDAVRFLVYADGMRCGGTGPLHRADGARQPSIEISWADELRLVTIGSGATVADWGSVRLSGRSPGTGDPIVAPRTISRMLARVSAESNTRPAYRVASRALEVLLDGGGGVLGLQIAGRKAARFPATAETALAGCDLVGDQRARSIGGGGVEFTRRLQDPVTGRSADVVERFTPTKTSVRWTVEVRGTGAPWSTAIQTAFRWPTTSATRFWTAWADPRGAGADGWSDPCRTMPTVDATWCYGGPIFKPRSPETGYIPARYDVTGIPLACFLEPKRDIGVTLALSPEDDLLDVTVRTTTDGEVVFSRLNNRIEKGRPVRFSADLIAHAADWRPAMAWMAARYPRYFDPALPVADDIAGTAAYSTYQGELDAEKLRKMAFRVNWQASYEFPYFGMYLPPCPPDEEWINTRGVRTSQNSLNAYYERMRVLGFHVLSYFNVTEFGTRLQIPPPGTPPPDPLWKDGTAFLFTRLKDAILPDADGKPIGSWEGSVAMDPGDPAYADFLCEQAKRHVDRTPATSGVCIDRMDWLRYYNATKDDGVSWFEGGPARSLVNSWRGVIARIAPIMHRAGKVIYVNNHVKRLDTLKDLDGFYDEFGHIPPSFNLTALQAVRRPYLAWTPDVGTLRHDPDAYLQRHLYMGAFPTAPYPGNDHTILPDDWAERYYMDYGPLLDTLRGRKWVLAAHAVSVTGGQALANVFSVPGGYVVPVTFGGKQGEATVVLKGLPELKTGRKERAVALHPGASGEAAVECRRDGEALRMRVPLVRGCAMVRLTFEGGER